MSPGRVALAVALVALVTLVMTTTPDTQQGRPPGDATCPRCSSALAFCLYREDEAMLACTKKECAFPLDTDDVDALCLPATDSRVLAGDALAVLRQANEESGRAPNSGAPLLSSLLAESPSCRPSAVDAAAMVPPAFDLGSPAAPPSRRPG